MLRHLIKVLKNENGQAIVELAIALPILLIILGGIIDFGWLFTNQNAIDHCARGGARYAIVNATGTDATTVIKNYTKSIAPANIADSLVITVTFTNTVKPRLGDVIINISADVSVLTPITGVFTGGQKVKLSSSCTMKVE